MKTTSLYNTDRGVPFVRRKMEAIIDYLNSHLYVETFLHVTRSHLIQM